MRRGSHAVSTAHESAASVAKRFGAAVAIVAAAAVLQKQIWPLIPPSPELLFYPAVLLVARVAGLGPAIVGIGVSIALQVFWFLPPYGSFKVSASEDILGLVIYAVLCASLAVLLDRLQRSEWKSRVTIDAAPIPTALLGRDARVLYANPAMIEALGPCEDQDLRSIVHPEDAAALERALVALTSGSTEHRTFNARFVGRERRVMFVEGTLSPTPGRGIERGVVQLVDVTARKSAEADRERALATLRAVVDECPEGIIFVERGGELVTCNAAALAILGTTPAFSADALERLRDAEGRPLAPEQRPMARALAGERVAGVELCWLGPNGEVPVLVNAAPLPAAEGEGASALVVFQDISELKELERLRVQWNAVVAHDLRQPINTILLLTQLLSRKSKVTHASLDEVDAIRRATRRLNTMVQDLLDASRLEVRNLPLARRAVKLDVFVAERVRELGAGADQKRRFDLLVRDENLAVWADPERLAQIVDNLLSNALKYGDPEAAIRLELGKDGEQAFLAVRNQGEPIPADEVPHLFERFRRTRAAQRKGTKGIGLGLYITRELVVAHGGEIHCESDATAKATTFRFTIPLATPASERCSLN